MDEFKEQKLHVLDVLLYYFHLLPEILRNLLPVVLLLSLLYALTTHARHNEITAMRAAGVGMWRISMPYFLIALVATGAQVVIQEIWLPRSMPEAEKIIDGWYHESSGKNPNRWKGPINFVNALDRRIWTIQEYDLLEEKMYGVDIAELLPSGKTRRIIADTGIQTNGVWVVENAVEYVFERSREDGETVERKHTRLPLRHISETPAYISSQIKLVALEGSNVNRVVSTQFSIAEILECQHLNPNLEEYISNLLSTKLHAQIASPFTCIVVVLIALPFSVRSGRRDMFLGVTGSIFMCFGYFILQRITLPLGITGQIPGYLAAWLPNLLFGTAGLWLLRRVY